MIIYGAYIFAIITALGLAIFYTKKTPWWIYPLLLILPFPIIWAASEISEHSQTSANEFWGGVVTDAAYSEPWNEWVSKTCTRQNCTGSGKDQVCTTESYDCSYCDHHSESYDFNSTIGGSSDAEAVWLNADALWQTTEYVGKRESDCDGDPGGKMYRAKWPGDSATLLPYFLAKTYENRVQAAPTLFSYQEVDPAQVPVVAYPAPESGIDNQAVLNMAGDVSGVSQASGLLSWYNARYGEENQCHAYLLIVRNQPQSFGRAQEAYWKGGGKNELTTIVNLDASNKPTWAHVFSWSPSKMAHVVIRDSILRMPVFNAVAAVELIGQQGVKKFVRKQFKDFSYIQVEPSATAVVLTYIFILLGCVGAVVGLLLQDPDTASTWLPESWVPKKKKVWNGHRRVSRW